MPRYTAHPTGSDLTTGAVRIMTTRNIKQIGIVLPNGCRAVHGTSAHIKEPFTFTSLSMHELDAGDSHCYRGQFGFIPFRDDSRLPRHIHIEERYEQDLELVAERILVLNGVALTELAGEIYVVAPGTMVEIEPGIPHTWTACPPGVVLPDGIISEGQFLMVYEYSEQTGFYPPRSTKPISNIADYERYDGDLEAIRFPRLNAKEVIATGTLIWKNQTTKDLRLAN
jgi:hypothetical protein